MKKLPNSVHLFFICIIIIIEKKPSSKIIIDESEDQSLAKGNS